MNLGCDTDLWLRRAQPLLGTLLEIGVRAPGGVGHAALNAAFDAVRCIAHRLAGRHHRVEYAQRVITQPLDNVAGNVAIRRNSPAGQLLPRHRD